MCLLNGLWVANGNQESLNFNDFCENQTLPVVKEKYSKTLISL